VPARDAQVIFACGKLVAARGIVFLHILVCIAGVRTRGTGKTRTTVWLLRWRDVAITHATACGARAAAAYRVASRALPLYALFAILNGGFTRRRLWLYVRREAHHKRCGNALFVRRRALACRLLAMLLTCVALTPLAWSLPRRLPSRARSLMLPSRWRVLGMLLRLLWVRRYRRCCTARLAGSAVAMTVLRLAYRYVRWLPFA